jgi:Disaggregatase related
LRAAPLYAIDSQNVEAFGNKITTRTDGALRLWNCQHVRFYSNVIDAQLDSLGGNPGFQIEDSKGEMQDIEICNNILCKTWSAGIWLISYNKGVSNNQGTLILNNFFYQTGQSYNIPYTDGIVNDSFKGTFIHNNVFDGVKNNAIRNQEGDQGTEIKDNIFTNTHIHNGISQAGTGYSIADLVSTDISITNNCFYNKQNGKRV